MVLMGVAKYLDSACDDQYHRLIRQHKWVTLACGSFSSRVRRSLCIASPNVLASSWKTFTRKLPGQAYVQVNATPALAPNLSRYCLKREKPGSVDF